MPSAREFPGESGVRYDRVTIPGVMGEIEVAYSHCSGWGQSRWPMVEQLESVGGLSEGARPMAAEAGGLIGGFEMTNWTTTGPRRCCACAEPSKMRPLCHELARQRFQKATWATLQW